MITITSANILSNEGDEYLSTNKLPVVGNVSRPKICQRPFCPRTGLSGILGGTEGTVRLQKRTKRKRTIRN